MWARHGVHDFNPSTGGRSKQGSLGILGQAGLNSDPSQPKLHSEILSQKQQQQKNLM